MRLTSLFLGATLAGSLVVSAPSSNAATPSLPLDIASFRNSQCVVPTFAFYGSCAVDMYRSFDAATMPSTNQITVNNVVFNWPNVGATPTPGTMDTVMADGRVIPVPNGKAKGYKALSALLETHPGRPAKSPIVFTISYTDGSSQKLTTTACNMVNKGAGVLPEVRSQYIHKAFNLAVAPDEGCVDQAIMLINSKKTPKSITLPTTGDMIQALSFTMQKSLPKKGPIFN